MSILNRITSIFKAKANAVLNEIENPEEALGLSIIEMREQLDKIKKSIVEVTTIKKELESQLIDIKGKIKIAEEQAELSVASNREDLVQAALGKKQDLLNQEKRLSSQIEVLQQKVKDIKANKDQLEEKIYELENKKEELIARSRAADAQIAVKEVITGISNDISNINERVDRAEQKIKEKSAKAEAIDELVDLGALDKLDEKDMIEKELKKIQKDEAVKRELERLKQRNEGGAV